MNGNVATGMSEDVSPGGMYVAVDKQVTAGLPIEITIVLPDNLVEAKGRIAWVNNKNEPRKPEFSPGFGIHFLEFKEDAGELFKAFVNGYIPATSPQGNN